VVHYILEVIIVVSFQQVYHFMHNDIFKALDRFYKFTLYLEFPAVYAEPAVIDQLPFIRKALDAASFRRKFPAGICTHVCSVPLVILTLE
jgi:hypothetical protein